MKVRNLSRNKSGTIDMEIEHPKFGWIPFTASQNDIEAHGRELYEMADRGEFGEVAPYVDPQE